MATGAPRRREPTPARPGRVGILDGDQGHFDALDQFTGLDEHHRPLVFVVLGGTKGRDDRIGELNQVVGVRAGQGRVAAGLLHGGVLLDLHRGIGQRPQPRRLRPGRSGSCRRRRGHK